LKVGWREIRDFLDLSEYEAKAFGDCLAECRERANRLSRLISSLEGAFSKYV
jgi:hypothetical protein